LSGSSGSGGETGNWLIRNARFIIKNRMYGFNYWRSLYRFIKFKVRRPGIKTEGFVFLPKHYDISKGKNAEMIIGGFTWIGEGCAFRAHEGVLRIGRKCVFGGKNTINCYNHIEVGEEGLWADNIYVVDFTHWFIDPMTSIRSQGIHKDQVIINRNVWIAEKATVLRGVTVGEGSVIGAHSLVIRDVPDYAVVGGVPARILNYRRSPIDVAWDEGRY
jgi:acetyltransferase-like isoleucine patch superfamily enzyme